MARINPRNNGLKGNDLIKFKYQYLTDRGIDPKYARKFRKQSWENIDQAIEIKKAGLLNQVALPPKQAKIKTKGKRDKQPKNIEPGYHWRKGYFRNGKWIEGRQVKNPTAKEKKPRQSFSYPKLLIFWRDQTEQVDGQSLLQAVRQSERMRMDKLIQEIKKSFNTKEGSIGKVVVEIAHNQGEEIAFINKYANYTLIYSDIPRYKPLLTILASLGVYIYQPNDKQNTAQEIALMSAEINSQVGRKLLNDLGL